jgi:hypothetical protein
MVANVSQFTYGGESACPFGTLACGEQLLLHNIDPFTSNEDSLLPILQHAVQCYQQFHGHAQGQHMSIIEIIQNQNMFQVNTNK